MKSDKKLKIGIVFDDSLDRPDGVQQYIFRLSEFLTERGHEVHYFVGETVRNDLTNIHSIARNINVSFNGNKMSVPKPVSAAKISKLLDEINIDIIHIQTPYSPLMGGIFIEQAAKKQIPIVGTFHILPYSPFVVVANKALSLLNASTKRHISEVMSVSPPASQFAKKIYGYSGEIVPNPIRIADFSVKPTDKNQVPHIVFLGRLVERKGAMKLLEAVEHIKTHNFYEGDFRVTIAGKGELLESMKRFTDERGLYFVHFPGFIAENDKAELLESADIVALPSISGESFGISVVEALAASRGVVLSGNNPGYASVLHGMPELLIEPNDTANFAERLAYWLTAENDRKTMANKQKDYAKQFDIEIVGEKILQSYARALHKRK